MPLGTESQLACAEQEIKLTVPGFEGNQLKLIIIFKLSWLLLLLLVLSLLLVLLLLLLYVIITIIYYYYYYYHYYYSRHNHIWIHMDQHGFWHVTWGSSKRTIPGPRWGTVPNALAKRVWKPCRRNARRSFSHQVVVVCFWGNGMEWNPFLLRDKHFRTFWLFRWVQLSC